ncbi:MAG: hypothetical protein IIU48_08035 [Prevotella sp.]|nr:hypothetical protein [Prevotella sp.]MBQ5506506.1 hypothetical protein [Prevotella sp.]
MTRKFFAVGMVALVAAAFSACGGGSNSGEKATDEISTDGVLGELPKVTAYYAETLSDLRDKIFSGQVTEEEGKKALADFDALREEQKAKLLLTKDALDGKEIPVEVADDLPLKMDGNLKIEGKNQHGSINAKGTGEFLPSINFNKTRDIVIVPIDTEGKCIEARGKGGTFTHAETHGALNYKQGEKFELTAFITPGAHTVKKCAADMKRWSKLAKYVVMDKNSDAYKQLKEQLEAEKNAEELEAAKEVLGEK